MLRIWERKGLKKKRDSFLFRCQLDRVEGGKGKGDNLNKEQQKWQQLVALLVSIGSSWENYCLTKHSEEVLSMYLQNCIVKWNINYNKMVRVNEI